MARTHDKLEADELFALAFHVEASIRRCDAEIERLRDVAPAGAFALREVRDALAVAVRDLPPPSSVATAAEPRTPTTAAELSRALKVCGLLATVLGRKVARLQRGGAPNIAQIATAAADLLDAEFPDANKRGLGNTSIRNTVAAGLGALRD